MAGYIMLINDMESLERCVITGTYSTIMSDPLNGVWGIPQEGTFADYYSMKEGDSIYFFSKRKIYGVGMIKNVAFDCKYLNYIDADQPSVFDVKEYEKRKPLLSGLNSQNRCFCTFRPNPYFFMKSVDMDDALSSAPSKYKMLRTMWKVSFIKIDDEEDKALRDILYKRNEDSIITGQGTYIFDKREQHRIESKVKQEYRLSSYNMLLNARKGNRIKHEMAIEAALCDILSKENDSLFGKWDYISHQVAASPFKPIDYMDKMDVFGYRYIEGFDTISKYLVIEIKKDDANPDAIEQIMKYVDWINQEYAHGDYSMIEAYVVAADFPEEVKKKRNELCIRNFTTGYRPVQPCTWRNCKLVRYSYLEGKLCFNEEK